MFTTLYENRDKKVSQLIKLGDCLGRSLRENVSLFSIDGSNQIVIYITESNKVISGNYSLEKEPTISNITIKDSSIFNDTNLYEQFINNKVSDFVKGIYEDDYKVANSTFGEILNLWENRLKFDSVQKKLNEKTEKLSKIEKIIESEEFRRFIEIQPQLIQFLKTNYNKISRIPEIRNAVNLSNTISKAFDIPRLSHQTLEEQGEYVLKDEYTSSIYDMICRQELVKKELLESKKEFDTIWASNPSIQKLANSIFEEDEKIVEALSEAIKEVPYLAFASKNNLYKTFTNCLGNVDGLGVSEKDIQKYSSKIFEAKKEVRRYLINSLNEKFGINIQNLQEPPSFKSLINTQIIVLETLSRVAPNGGTVKKTLSELAESLKTKSGVEAIDLNDLIYEMFVYSGYGQILDESHAGGKYVKIDFKQISQDLGEIANALEGIQDELGGAEEGPENELDMASEYENDENLDQDAMMAAEEGEEAPEEEGMEQEEMPPEEMGQEEMPPEEDQEGMEPEEPAEEMPPEEKSPEDIKMEVAKLEAMIKNLADEINAKDTGEREEEEVD